MAKAKSGKQKKIFSPFLVSLAALTGWAAVHEPANFTNPAIAGAWLLEALAVGLLVRATLAVLSPVIKLCGEIFQIITGKSRLHSHGDAEP